MNLDHKAFSERSKMILGEYLNGDPYSLNQLENFIDKMQFFDLSRLVNDSEKKAFWINLYNGLTNYQIVKNRLQVSVWEKKDFFSGTVLKIGKMSFSLDDIEHGILRKNGERKNGKPRQFLKGDERFKLMPEQMDYRIHFALNCGSISCPPFASYDEDKIEQQLDMAEQSFSASEFILNPDDKTVKCSSIFVWYRTDFGKHYLNDATLSHYTIIERPYIWRIQ